jgi:wyosine [tRNA(Phe)-imidazoG37] synthetase (radical SAM superfamily)
MVKTRFVYGPVPSRRLGLSLGLSITPRKTCTVDCIYCQCGRTTQKTLRRESFFPVAEILAQVDEAVRGSRTEFITFSGEGEPTLNLDIGRLIRRLGAKHDIPVAVITNSTLLTDPQVRRDLYPADLVVPSLDAADQQTFVRVNRCHRDLKVDAIIDGLRMFRRFYQGLIWLEVMLVKGINDSPEHLVLLRRAVADIRPDRVHLNTVVRPPAERRAKPLSEDDLEQVRKLFGPGAEIAESPIRRPRARLRRIGVLHPEQAIIELVRNRPATFKDMERSLGIPAEQLRSALNRLTRHRQGRPALVKRVEFWGKVFYESGPA